MKKLMLLALCIVVSNCEFKVREADAQSDFTTIKQGGYNGISYTTQVINGMNYGFFATMADANTVTVVNHTKDSLEILYYKRQLGIE